MKTHSLSFVSTLFLFILLSAQNFLFAQVKTGLDLLFSPAYQSLLKGQKIGLLTNHTAIDSHHQAALQLFKKEAVRCEFELKALFAPEHGLDGSYYAAEKIKNSIDNDKIPVFSLHGATRRPTAQMLDGLTLIVYDIQDIGSRSYTYISTLFYVMEEAAKRGIAVIVLDRPNPLNGLTIDGPLLEKKWRSFVGYIDVPYCHGMTVGELASYFNEETNVGCKLTVVPMQGWKREMRFSETGLTWVPTSPNIPEAETVFFYPSTGLIGELQLVNIGIGYTLPFKVIGAPWIDAVHFTNYLNQQNFPGVHFLPFYYRPLYGKFAGQNCQGALIIIKDYQKYLPVSTQYLILGMLKSLYPKPFKEALAACKGREEMFNKVNGTAEVYRLLNQEPYIIWKLLALHKKERETFKYKRQKYLISDYH